MQNLGEMKYVPPFNLSRGITTFGVHNISMVELNSTLGKCPFKYVNKKIILKKNIKLH